MSQDDSINLGATFMRDDQSRNEAPSITPIPTYSLAGQRSHEPPTYRPRTSSFVTAEYEQLNPNYNQPETTPIWGLAKPFPHIVRRGMRPRKHFLTKDHRIVSVPENASAPDQSTQVVPQLSETPGLAQTQSQQDIRVHPFPAGPWDQQPIEPSQSQTSRTSRPHAPSSNHVGTGQRPEPIEEEDFKKHQEEGRLGNRVRVRASQDTEQDVDALLTAPTYPATAHDHTIQPNGLSANEAARQKVRNRAHTAERDFALKHSAPTTNWEETSTTHSVGPTKTTALANEAEEKAAEEAERHYHNKWAELRYRMRQPLAEFLGTFVAFTIALSASMVNVIARDTYGNYLTSALSWGFGVMVGIYTSGGVSGAHLNPAISIMLAVFRGFPWHYCIRYIIAQFLGAFAAAAVVYALFRDGILHAEAGLLRSSTGLVFYTQPQPWISNTTAFFSEFVAAAIMATVILALGDDSNTPPGAGMHAFIIGLFVTTLSLAFSYNTGAALNPARDFGPRLVTLAAGYGREVFTDRNCWWLWGCWAAPVTGVLVGAFVYDLLIFTGGESPVNYPRGQWGMRVDKVKNKATRGTWETGEARDEEKGVGDVN